MAFSNLEITTKLYWPESIDEIPNAEFVVVDCLSCNTPMVVYTEHTMSVSKESWGRILYRCRKLFGNGMELKIKTRTIRDHWHAHITKLKYER